MPAERCPTTGRFLPRSATPPSPAPVTDSEVIRNYVVPVPNLFLWPVLAVRWAWFTILRALALVAIVAALIAVWGWYVGNPADSSSAVQPARAIVPRAFSATDA